MYDVRRKPQITVNYCDDNDTEGPEAQWIFGELLAVEPVLGHDFHNV